MKEDFDVQIKRVEHGVSIKATGKKKYLYVLGVDQDEGMEMLEIFTHGLVKTVEENAQK